MRQSIAACHPLGEGGNLSMDDDAMIVPRKVTSSNASVSDSSWARWTGVRDE
jgi:hypothetical protein